MFVRNYYAFAYIKLLVIVLIISFLVSVAWPQYQDYIRKNKTARAWTVLRKLDQAVEEFCSKNPQGTASSSTIAIKIPIDDDWTYGVDVGCSELKEDPDRPTASAHGKYSMKTSDNLFPYLATRNEKRYPGSYVPD